MLQRKKNCLQPDLHEIWQKGGPLDPNNRKNTMTTVAKGAKKRYHG